MTSGYSPRPMGALRVSLLGGFQATVGDASLPAGGAKQRAVFAMLALRAGDTVPESRLIDGIWGDATPSSVRSSLQVYVAHWRRVLGEADCSDRIERQGSGYRLEMDAGGLDIHRYYVLLELARTALAEERFVVAVGRFDEAQALWRGDALQDFVGMPFHQWETASLEPGRVQALADRTDALLGAGRGSDLVGPLEGLVAQHPYEERFRAQLMHALYRSGRQVDALRSFDQARTALVDIGIEAGPQLRAMEQRVLQQDPDLESRVSPFAHAAPPEPITSLVGREADVAELVSLASRGVDRLVTLTGPGGVGKSRLALEVANRVQEEGWLPVAYVAIPEVADSSVVALAVNAAFGVPESWRERPVADIARMLGASPLLLVVDGVEHVHGSVRDVVSEVLQHGRHLRVLVTSRVPLGLNGERQVPVSPLACRAAVGEPLREVPAVELFIERAERFQSGLLFDDGDVEVIGEICEGVDGLPLAIELAAARSGTLGVEELRKRLVSRLDVVAAPYRAGEQRHRSLRDVIGWSFGLLSADAQTLLARLSVFSGGFSLAHVEQIWGDAPGSACLLDSFEELDRHSMLTRLPGKAVPRFRLLATVREFAGEVLGGLGETADAHHRLIRWVHRGVEAAGGRVGAGAKQFDHLELEVDNVRAAVLWALENASSDDAAELTNSLYVWWMARGRAEELGRWYEQSLGRPQHDERRRAQTELYLGRIHGRKDRVEESNMLLYSALERFRQANDSDGIVHALSSLVENCVHQRTFETATPLVNEALLLARGSISTEVRCRALHAACWLAGALRDLDAASYTAQLLVNEASRAGLVEFEAKTLADLAWIARLRPDPESAHRWATLAAESAVMAATGGSVVSAYTEIALANLALGRPEDGIKAIAAALSFESGDDLSPSSVLRLVLPLAAFAEQLDEKEITARAVSLLEIIRAVDLNIKIWPADEDLVGSLFIKMTACDTVGRPVATDVDAIKKAREIGEWLQGSWLPARSVQP
ncbi:MAG: AAA domain-containing protein [Actinobacteria bacterium]|nr:AAA domain-containing protein [Actinomycetota bacterium]